MKLSKRPNCVLMRGGQFYSLKGYRMDKPPSRPRIPTLYIVVARHRKFSEGMPAIGSPTEPYHENLVYLGAFQKEKTAWDLAHQWLEGKCKEHNRPVEICGPGNADNRSLNREKKVSGGIWLGLLYAYAFEAEVWELPLLDVQQS